MLKIAVCDDNLEFLSDVKETIRSWKSGLQKVEVACFTDGDALISAHAIKSFDIIFLDVIMPIINGIETAREIRANDKDVVIVFLTSSKECAIEAFSVKADDYLLKPLNALSLYTCLDESLTKIKNSSKSMIIKCADSVHRVKLDEIEYVEAQNKHTVFALSNGTALEAIELMNSYDDKLLLDDGFFKCHRSYIVNIYHINSYTRKEIRTYSDRHIPISRNTYKQFEETYFSVLFGKLGEN